MSQPQYNPPLPMPPKRGGFPWLMVGCGCLFALALIIVLLGVAAYVMIVSAVDTYSDKAPVQLPVSSATPEEFTAIDSRITAFREAVKQGTPVEPLVLTGEDINAIIANDPDWVELKGRVHVSIDGDKVTGQISIPLDKLRMAGRYFNGSASFSVQLRNGILQLHMESVELKGKPAPEQIMAAWRGQNWAEGVNRDPKFQPAIEGLESIEVKDGQAIFTPKIKKSVEVIELEDSQAALAPDTKTEI